MKIVVMNNVTLDGVIQAPGRADEDTRGGFAYGGWASQNVDEPDPEIGAAMRRYIDLSRLTIVKAGDFKAAAKAASKQN